MWATADADEIHALTNAIGYAVMVVEVCGDRQFRILSMNRRSEKSSGFKHADVSGLFLDEVFSPRFAHRLSSNYQRCVDNARLYEYEEAENFPAGRVSWKTILTPIKDEGGRVVRLVATSTDIASQQIAESELRKTAKVLRETESRLQAAVQGAELGIWEWDLQSRTIWMADHWAPSLGTFTEPVSVSVKEWLSFVHPDHRKSAIVAAERVIKGEAPSYGVEWLFRSKDGGWQWRHAYGTATEHNERGRPIRICGAYRDISQQKKNQQELQRLTAELKHRAIHDSLTGVLNRGAIIDALENEISRAQREKTSVTVALIDADHFKAINDTYGHQVGDYALQAIAARMQSVLRPYDHLGRYGGEEFLVVAPAQNGVRGLHKRICEAIAGTPFSTSAGELRITVSIGVAESNASINADKLILRADEALYGAKEAGRNRVVNWRDQDVVQPTSL